MHAQGVASCLKHWPGIGIGSADPHYGATIIDVPLQELLDRRRTLFDRSTLAAGERDLEQHALQVALRLQ